MITATNLKLKGGLKRISNEWPNSMEVRGNALNIIHGANGSGKTTLIHILRGEKRGLAEGVVSRIGFGNGEPTAYLPQRFWSWSDITIAGVCELAGRAIADHKLQSLSRESFLRGNYYTSVGTLSGGMARRFGVSLVMALPHKAHFYDEPLQYLDQTARLAVVDQLHLLVENKHLVVVVTHDPAVFLRTGREINTIRLGPTIQKEKI